MIRIHALTEHATGVEIAAAQELFRRYAEFLGAIAACHAFDFARFAEETAALPMPYTGRGGELLMAVADEEEGARCRAVGCLGYRAVEGDTALSLGLAARAAGGGTCELKRLFVVPELRGQRLGELLVREALRRAAQRGFGTAMLDTEPTSMQPAYRTYTRLGFTEFRPVGVGGGGPVVTYLQRSLP